MEIRETHTDYELTHTAQAPDAMLESVGQRIRARMFGLEDGAGGPPERIDRFVIDRMLGAGGMGTVYEAWDEELQRRVAIKFLRTIARSETGEKRFYREAQGLARIAHPNVVSVFDVGRWEDKVWIAMEYVPGKTLGRWAAELRRKPADIVRRWADAGRGLAAIHAAGLVHRDIKPANILLGDDGRVRIIDFGLVKVSDTIDEFSSIGLGDRPASMDGSTYAGSGAGYSSSASLNESLTDVDSFVGTPAYAAPEHWDRRYVDARSDQYSFCVALWEALVGSRPSRRERERGGLVPLPKDKRMSKRVYRALCRGLALDPQERFPDMLSLVEALEPPSRRWLAPVVAAGITAIVATSAALALRPPVVMAEPEDPCANAGDPVAELWTPRRKEVVHERLDPELAGQAEELLDGWAQDWRQAAQDSCEDVLVRQLYSSDVLDRRGQCLDRELDGFEAMLQAIEEGTVDSASELIRWFSALDDPQECLGEAALRTNFTEPPPEHTDEVARLRRQLIRLSVQSDQGQAARVESVRTIHQRAQAIGWRPLIAEASFLLAGLLRDHHERAESEQFLGEALDIAIAIDDLELASRIWSARITEAELDFDARSAKWALERELGMFGGLEPSARQRARLECDRGRLAILNSDYEQAETHLRDCIERYAAEPTWAWSQATAMRSLAQVLELRGHADEALEVLEQTRDLELHSEQQDSTIEATPAQKLLREAIALYTAGEYAKARTKGLEGLAAAEAEQGPRGMKNARFHNVLAATCDRLGDLDCARHHAEQADSISLVAGGPRHNMRIDVLSTLGVMAYRDGRYTAARETFYQALVLSRDKLGPNSESIADAERNLAEVDLKLEDYAAAQTLAEHAVEVYRTKLGPEHPKLGKGLLLLATIHANAGHPERACDYTREAAPLIPASDKQFQRSLQGHQESCAQAPTGKEDHHGK